MNRGVIPCDMKKSSPSTVLAIASSIDENPNGRANSIPATKFGITCRGPKTSAASRIRRCHWSRPT